MREYQDRGNHTCTNQLISDSEQQKLYAVYGVLCYWFSFELSRFQ